MDNLKNNIRDAIVYYHHVLESEADFHERAQHSFSADDTPAEIQELAEYMDISDLLAEDERLLFGSASLDRKVELATAKYLQLCEEHPQLMLKIASLYEDMPLSQLVALHVAADYDLKAAEQTVSGDGSQTVRDRVFRILRAAVAVGVSIAIIHAVGMKLILAVLIALAILAAKILITAGLAHEVDELIGEVIEAFSRMLAQHTQEQQTPNTELIAN